MAVVELEDVKQRLGKTLQVDDYELLSMIDAAVAEYEDFVGPVTTKTLRFDGGRGSLILPMHATVTAVAYSDGTEVDIADLDHDTDSGILHWGYDTAGWFTAGSRNVLVTFTVEVPANHREAIIADVAGYFAATQRGGGQSAPRFPGEGYAEAYDAPGSPLTLFPRIRALAATSSAIA